MAVSFTIRKAIRLGLKLVDFAVIQTLESNSPLSRQDLEKLVGASAETIRTSTIKLRDMGIIERDREHKIGGALHRAAKYKLKS